MILYSALSFDTAVNHYWMPWSTSPSTMRGCKKVMTIYDPFLYTQSKDHMLISYLGNTKQSEQLEKFWETCSKGRIVKPREKESLDHFHGRCEGWLFKFAHGAIESGQDILVVGDLALAHICAKVKNHRNRRKLLSKVYYLNYVEVVGRQKQEMEKENIIFENLEEILPQDYAYRQLQEDYPITSALSCLP